MKVTQEKLPASQVALNIEISAEASKQAYEDVVRSLSRTIRLPGFRQGKVPRQILLQRLGSQRVRAEALEKLVQDSLDKAIEKVEVEVLGNYQLVSHFDELIEQYKPGEPLTFAASVDVPPAVEPGDYQSISIQAEEVVYDEQQVTDFLDRQRSKQATLVPVEGRPAQLGDVVVVDYKGYLQTDTGEVGEPITGAEATDFELEMESGRFLEDLIQGIVGMTVASEQQIPVQFPDDYAREDLAGKAALFTVTLQEIKEKELPELDDEFAEEASEFETMAELREHLETQHRERAAQATRANIENAIAKVLQEQTVIDLPKTLIDQEVDRQVRQAMVEMERYGLDVDKLFSSSEVVERVREEARPEAIRKLRISLSLREIAKRESLPLDEVETDRRIKEILRELDDRQLDMKRVREFVENELREESALEWLREQATIKLVPAGTLATDEDDDELAADASDAPAMELDAAAATVEVVAERAEPDPDEPAVDIDVDAADSTAAATAEPVAVPSTADEADESEAEADDD
ncbi:MAG: trigger factor [Spirulinaceae cyanobacterium RM2_2_10]|nr:trigger factor [Spirulinaceae cyanobacterium SM2_1_0]NJO20673.1 trigger factor [Spirulinaceae cyanobacterium RM2_2_10]